LLAALARLGVERALSLARSVAPRKVLGPIDDAQQLARRHVDIRLVPIVLHLNLHLPHHARLGRRLRDHQARRHAALDARLGEARAANDLRRRLGVRRLGLERRVGRHVKLGRVQPDKRLPGRREAGDEREQRVDGVQRAARHLARAQGVAVVREVPDLLVQAVHLRVVGRARRGHEAGHDDLRSRFDDAPNPRVAPRGIELRAVRGNRRVERLARRTRVLGCGKVLGGECDALAAGVERATPRDDAAVAVNVDVHVAIADLEAADELPGVDVRDARRAVRVRLRVSSSSN
jgi:hypothetical protein